MAAGWAFTSNAYEPGRVLLDAALSGPVAPPAPRERLLAPLPEGPCRDQENLLDGGIRAQVPSWRIEEASSSKKMASDLGIRSQLMSGSVEATASDVRSQLLSGASFLVAQLQKHQQGLCKPCAFVYKWSSCYNGVSCEFCHLCAPGTKRRRKREFRSQQRALRAASTEVVAPLAQMEAPRG
eukprot:CAMPEP_0168454466 /NCGR_PEP_ID=MMETSP0228-20121227/50234_1 /TAXON_ID=133427 /ORGANISM="Protoceratium reticulatum, Strain CCCM 535 (=CCMP 1889)" /LENGTH=181 /DNA_ID=CAMNT_0008469251 /DNA_START=21 /DNA_END=566 /DNA_ORIENTATION=+